MRLNGRKHRMEFGLNGELLNTDYDFSGINNVKYKCQTSNVKCQIYNEVIGTQKFSLNVLFAEVNKLLKVVCKRQKRQKRRI